MRILFLSPIGHIGGAERVLLDLIEEIKVQSNNIEVCLLLLADGPLASAAREVGANVMLVPAPEATTGLGDSAATNGGSGRFEVFLRALLASPGVLRLAARLRNAIEGINP